MLSQSLFLLLKIHRQSLHMSQVAHQARAHLNVCSMKQLRVKWDASGLQGYLPLSIKYVSSHLFTYTVGDKRYCESKVFYPRTQQCPQSRLEPRSLDMEVRPLND